MLNVRNPAVDSVGLISIITKNVRNNINYYEAKILSIEQINIYSGKATIKQKKLGIWQFHVWVSNERHYYEKSLRAKRRAEAIDKAEEMYFDLQNELKDGRKLFFVSLSETVAIYLGKTFTTSLQRNLFTNLRNLIDKVINNDERILGHLHRKNFITKEEEEKFQTFIHLGKNFISNEVLVDWKHKIWIAGVGLNFFSGLRTS